MNRYIDKPHAAAALAIVKPELERLVGGIVDMDQFDGDGSRFVFVHKHNAGDEYGDYVGAFTLSQFTDCEAVVVSHDVFVTTPFQKRGIGTLLNRLRQDMARRAGYGMMICTARVDNEAQNTVLDRAGWTKAGPAFMGDSTPPLLQLWVLKL